MPYHYNRNLKSIACMCHLSHNKFDDVKRLTLMLYSHSLLSRLTFKLKWLSYVYGKMDHTSAFNHVM